MQTLEQGQGVVTAPQVDPLDAELEVLERKVSVLEVVAQGFATITAENQEEAMIHIGACKAAERWIEDTRDGKVRPFNDKVKQINTKCKGAASKWEAVRIRFENGVSAYRTEQKRIADEAQRIALEKARQEQAAKEEALRIEREALAKKEEEERIARETAELEEANIDFKIERAERELTELQESMPENMTAAQQRQLRTKEERVLTLRAEKAALEPVVIDTTETDRKREEIARLEAEAAVPVVAQVVEKVAKTVKTAAGSITIKDDKKTWILPGWNQTGKYKSMDVVNAKVFAALPTEIQWLLKVSVLDVPALNQSYKNRERFPHPFGEVAVFGGSTVRTAKG